MTRNSFFPGLTAVLRCAACWCSAFWLFTLTSVNGLQGIAPVPFFLGSAVCYGLLRRFLSVPRTVPALTAFGCVLTAVLSGVLLWQYAVFPTLTGKLFGVIAIGSTVAQSARVILEPPPAAKCITAMELTALYFLLFTWAQATAGLPPVYCLPLLTALILSLLVLPYQRLTGGGERQGRSRGFFLLSALVGLILLVLVLFLLFGAAPLGEGVSALARTLRSWGGTLLAALGRFLIWLFSHIHLSDTGTVPDVEPLPPSGTAQPAAESSPYAAAALLVLAIGLALLGIWGVLRFFRRRRVGGISPDFRTDTIHRRRVPFSAWLRRCWHGLTARFRLAAFLLFHRGTPQALYLSLVWAARRLRQGPKTGETPAAFLTRLQTLCPENPAFSAALHELALALDRQLFSPTPTGIAPESAAQLRRGIRKLPRRRASREASHLLNN